MGVLSDSPKGWGLSHDRGENIGGWEGCCVVSIPEVPRSRRNGFQNPGHTLCSNSVASRHAIYKPRPILTELDSQGVRPGSL